MLILPLPLPLLRSTPLKCGSGVWGALYAAAEIEFCAFNPKS